MKNERNKPCHCGSGKKFKKCHWLIKLEDDRLAEEAFRARLGERRKQLEAEAEERRAQVMAKPQGVVHRRMPFTLVAALAAGAVLSHRER